MKMLKPLAIVTALLMLILCMAGCGEKNTSSPGTASSQNSRTITDDNDLSPDGNDSITGNDPDLNGDDDNGIMDDDDSTRARNYDSSDTTTMPQTPSSSAF